MERDSTGAVTSVRILNVGICTRNAGSVTQQPNAADFW